MNVNRYSLISNSNHDAFEFYSEGPKGMIKKVIEYTEIDENIYNLAFGDWNEEEQKIDDKIRTNNDDRDKVLATVAWSIIDFINFHPVASVFFQGSTSSRTRLYQMKIAEDLENYSELFEIFGHFKNDWEPFQKNKNYKALMLIPK
jgi:hypothetical protein